MFEHTGYENESMEIPYLLDGGNCITPCPFDRRLGDYPIRVGSTGCEQCPFHYLKDIDNRIVECLNMTGVEHTVSYETLHHIYKTYCPHGVSYANETKPIRVGSSRCLGCDYNAGVSSKDKEVYCAYPKSQEPEPTALPIQKAIENIQEDVKSLTCLRRYSKIVDKLNEVIDRLNEGGDV